MNRAGPSKATRSFEFWRLILNHPEIHDAVNVAHVINKHRRFIPYDPHEQTKVDWKSVVRDLKDALQEAEGGLAELQESA